MPAPTTQPVPNEPYATIEIKGAIGYITLNRPEKLNAFLNHETPDLEAAFRQLNEVDAVKVIVFRGRGRAFSSGHDVKDLGLQYAQGAPEGKPTQRSRLRVDLERRGVVEAIAKSPKVVIAEGKGYVLGGALNYYLAADILIAAEGTVFGSPPARMIGTGGGIVTMLKLGIATSNEMQYLGRFFRAEELFARGVLNRVVPLDQLEATTEAAAELACGIPADGLAIGKLANRIAWEILGAEADGLLHAMSHVLQTQQKLGEDDWNLFRERNESGHKRAWQNRDTRWVDPLQRYDPTGVIA